MKIGDIKFLAIAMVLMIPSLQIIPTNFDDIQILYGPMFGFDTYLINRNGDVINTWHNNFPPGLAAYSLPNGDILRPRRLNLQQGGGGGLQEITPEGEIIWDYVYNSYNNHTLHHDIEPLPNGNVLALSFFYLSYAELVELGRDPANTMITGMELEKILEIKPTGPTSGDIIWSWYSGDHLIQDFDPTKQNYGVVSDHPELLDINYPAGLEGDLLHCNSIDYNIELDQILVSSRNFNEFWIINHTNGDLVYRWGNPESYKTPGERKLFMQHDASWVGNDHVLVFNNGKGRGYSSVDEINITTSEMVWTYTKANWYAPIYCSAERLHSGNTIICDSQTGLFFEVNPQKTIIWQYQCQFGEGSPYGNVFRIDVVEINENQVDCVGSFSWNNIKPGSIATGSFVIRNKGVTPLSWEISESPDWGDWTYSESSGVLEDEITINVSVVAPSEENHNYGGFIKVSNLYNQEDYDVVPVELRTPLVTHQELFGVKTGCDLLKAERWVRGEWMTAEHHIVGIGK
jgi:hypothetical protein